MPKTVSDATPNVFQIESGEKIKQPSKESLPELCSAFLYKLTSFCSSDMIMEICEPESVSVGIRALYQNKDVKNAIHSIEN